MLLLCGAVFVGGVAADHPESGHADWNAWGDDEDEQTVLPTTAGNYYLTKDFELTGTWNVPGTTNLCLNGHVIKITGAGSVIKIESDKTLHLYDCNSENKVHYFTYNSSGAWGYKELTPLEVTPSDAYKIFVLNGTGADKFTREAADKAVAEAPDGKFVYVIVTGGCITGGNANGGGVYVESEGTFNMDNGNIVGNTATVFGGGVCVVDGKFEMKGGSIAGNYAVCGGGVAVFGGSFTMSCGTISGNTATNEGGGGGVYVRSGTFIMENGSITGNTARAGGGVLIDSLGTFEMKGGSIAGNYAVCGGGVYVTGFDESNQGRFEMKGSASIKGNEATANGGGVYVQIGTFNMDNGTISGNTATDGGGVYVKGLIDNETIYPGTFTMEGSASIVGNKATGTGNNDGGGGVFVAQYGVFTMTGGTIGGSSDDKNTAQNGGGVYIDGGTFTMQNSTEPSPTHGTITGNTATANGGGVYVLSEGTFEVSGSPVISGNTVGGAANNVMLNSNFITVSDNLSGGEIHIYSSAAPTGQFGTIDTGVEAEFVDASCFISDYGSETGLHYVGTVDSTPPTNLVWSETLVYDIAVAGGIQHGTVSADAPYAPSGTQITLTPVADTGYKLTDNSLTASYNDGEAKTCEVTETSAGSGVYKFTMPAYEVTVSAGFEAIVSGISVGSIEHGSVTVSSDESGSPAITQAAAGSTVYLKPVAASGYKLTVDSLTASYNDGTAKTCELTETSSGSGVYTFTMPAYEVTVSAEFEPNTTYTVTFNGNKPANASGEVAGVPAAITGVASGTTTSGPTSAPTLAGHDFGGWYKEAACTNAWTFASDAVTANTTLYAKWTLHAEEPIPPDPEEEKVVIPEDKQETIPVSQDSPAVKVIEVDGVDSAVTLSQTSDVPVPMNVISGYNAPTVFTKFEITIAEGVTGDTSFVIEIANPNGKYSAQNIFLRHYSDGAWDDKHIKGTTLPADPDILRLSFPVDACSPFAVVYETPAARPSGGSSSQGGSSVWLTEPTTPPTVTPTQGPTPSGEPTVVPIETQTPAPATPAPFAGILAGLGAAVLLGLRRR